MTWLDTSGRLVFGKHRGRLAEEVAEEGPVYLRWIVDEVEECNEKDREVLSALLARRAGGRR